MNRRDALKLVAAAGAAAVGSEGFAYAGGATEDRVEKWGKYEIELKGPATGNPFLEVSVGAEFTQGARTVKVDGFYDGEGVYRVRWMPDELGAWQWVTTGNAPGLAGKKGSFTCVEPTAENHGPVGVRDTFHFAHADGKRYFPFGTTCYAWAFQSERMQELTLENLKRTEFNKVRMCILPKSLGPGEPPRHPFPMVNNKLELTHFDPEYFRHFEQRVADLDKLGVQADLILFHPYGKEWGYDTMPQEVNERYVRYVVARMGSLRNVWWSLANEYDLLKTWKMPEWDHLFHVIQETDVAGHLRSIHHSGPMYDYAKPWVTHASLQTYDFDKMAEWKKAWVKPVIFDEVQYEGNISRRWGNLSGEELTRRFWLGVTAGAYCTHGEVIAVKNSVDGLSADGGTMHGESPQRILFLRKLLEETNVGLAQIDGAYYRSANGNAGKPGEVILYYFDYHRPDDYTFPLPEGASYKTELIDPWAMTVTPLPGTFEGKSDITLSGRPYQAVRFRRV